MGHDRSYRRSHERFAIAALPSPAERREIRAAYRSARQLICHPAEIDIDS
jgi:hypothetical protein